MKMIPTTLKRKVWKKWLVCPALAFLLVLSSLSVYAGEQQNEQSETPSVTQDTGSELAAEGATSSEQNELLADEFDPIQPIDLQELEAAATDDWRDVEPHEGQVLHGGYVGFKNVGSGKYLTVPQGNATEGMNIIQYQSISTPNAQEFLLEYTYSTLMNEAYFRIFSLTADGTASYPVKSAENYPSTANVILDDINYLYLSDRWQIEHVRENYYCIYLASNPDYNNTKYALTAYGNSNGTESGKTTTSPGNVYLSPLNTSNDYQLWQICADGASMDLRGQEMLYVTQFDLNSADSLNFFYVPKRFNETITWISSNEYVAEISQNGILTALRAGTAQISLEADVLGEKNMCYSYITVILPNGLYKLINDSNGMWMDLHYNWVAENTPVQIYNNTDGLLNNPSMIFKIHYLGGNLYSIRSMRKNEMGVCCDNDNQSVILKDIGTSHDTVLNEGKWLLGSNEHGTYIYSHSYGTAKAITVPLNAASSDDLIIDVYSEDNQRQAWHIESVSEMAIGAQSALYVKNDLGDITVGSDYHLDVWFSHSSDEINGDVDFSFDLDNDDIISINNDEAGLFHTNSVGTVDVWVSVPSEYNVDPVLVSITVPYPTPSEGEWFVENALSGLFVSSNGQINYESSGVLTPFNDNITLDWEFDYVNQNYFRIKSKSTQSYLSSQPNNVLGAIVQRSVADDYSLWKVERTAGNRYRFINKAYESGNWVLAGTGNGLYLYGYTKDSNFNDEWYLNISGSELTILAIAESDRTRGQHAEQAKADAEQNNVDCNVIITDHIAVESVLIGMSTSEVFISRSHGAPQAIGIYSFLENGRTVSLRASDIYNYNTETPCIDLSECELVMFIGCSTADDINQRSITHAAVDAGAVAAIGFGDSIHVPHADEWMKAFLESYYENGGDIEEAREDALVIQSGGNMTTSIIVR
ncbi:MAG: hypothetical protein E7581_04860 [Ruminococcaceae bacterium]|nr:hypothetical protein [Oscillospiraceae bacterium]